MSDVAPQKPIGPSRISVAKTSEGLLIQGEAVNRFIREHRAALGSCLRDLMGGKRVAFQPVSPVIFDVQQEGGAQAEPLEGVAGMRIRALLENGAMRRIIVEGVIQREASKEAVAQKENGSALSPAHQNDAAGGSSASKKVAEHPSDPLPAEDAGQPARAQVIEEATERRGLLQRVKDGWWKFLAAIHWESALQRKEMVITGKGGGRRLRSTAELARLFDAMPTAEGGEKETPNGMRELYLQQMMLSASSEMNTFRRDPKKLAEIQEALQKVAGHRAFSLVASGVASHRKAGRPSASSSSGLVLGASSSDQSQITSEFQRLIDTAQSRAARLEGKLQGSDGKASAYGVVRQPDRKRASNRTL